jgi:serine/threonine protein kinase
LALDPEKRISAVDALKHPYFDIVRPRRDRFQKTSEAWITSKNSEKVSLT